MPMMIQFSNRFAQLLEINYVAYSISSLAETKDEALSFSREVEFMRGCPVGFVANGAFIVTSVGFELTAPML